MNNGLKPNAISTKNLKNQLIKGTIGVAIMVGTWSTFYTIDEGHVGIVKRFGEATTQVNPGLHTKVPFADTIEDDAKTD